MFRKCLVLINTIFLFFLLSNYSSSQENNCYSNLDNSQAQKVFNSMPENIVIEGNDEVFSSTLESYQITINPNNSIENYINNYVSAKTIIYKCREYLSCHKMSLEQLIENDNNLVIKKFYK